MEGVPVEVDTFKWQQLVIQRWQTALAEEAFFISV
jgi:hypothetical protein